MKAHRRNGIPTLMLDGGGQATSSAFGRLFQGSDIEKQRQRERTAAQRAGLRSVLAGLPSLFDPLEKSTYDAVMAATKPIRGFQRQGMEFPGPRTRGLNALNAESYSKALGDSFVNLGQFFDELKRQGRFAAALSPGETEAATASRKRAQEVVANLRAKIGEELNLANPIAEPVDEFGGAGSLEADILRQAQASSQAAEVSRQEQEGTAPQRLTQAQRAADALSGGVLRPQTTSAPAAAEAARQEQEGLAGTATTPAGTATTPAGTAATPAASEAARQEQEGLAGTAAEKGSPTPTTNPTVVTSIQSTISDIMGNEDAQFDEGKRLQELKETFGLGPTAMEKAAPGVTFALSLMGAQRAPGESPFNALIRSAGSAAEAAIKSKLALTQRERAIDSSLASRVFDEKKLAEQYARNREWIAVWNGGFDENGVAQAEYLRMNADQIQKANEAGLQIVPLNVISTATTAFATKSKAAAEATKDLNKLVIEFFKPTPVEMTFQTSPAVNGRRLTGFDPTNGQKREVVIADDFSGQGRLVNGLLEGSAGTLALVDQLEGLIDQSTGAINVASAAFGKARSLLNLGEDATAEDFYRAASEKGGVALSNLSGFAKSKINVDNAYNELGADGVKRLLNIQGDFSEEDLKKRLSENINNVRGHKPIEKLAENASADDKSAYEARVRFRAIQNALAAQLAPILLGESGRTISDADRVRVIALLGGFSDFSKAGVLTTAEEMRESTRMLKEILGKYKDKALQDAARMISSYDEASSYISPITKGALYSPSKDDEEVVGALRFSVQQFNKKKAGQAGQPSGGTPVSANKLLGDKR